MNAGNTLCSICRGHSAEMFCPCTSPETFLCESCIGPHAIKGIGRTHTNLPINQLPFYKIPGYSERLLQRIELFPQVSTLVRQKVTAIDKTIQEFAMEMQRAIWELIEYSNKTVEKLSQMKNELLKETEAALAEVERTLVEDQPRLTSRYGSAFRELTEQLQPFELLTCSINTSSPLAAVSIYHELLPPLEVVICNGLFAAPWGTMLELYNLKTQQTTKHNLTTGTYGCCIQLDRTTLMIVDREVRTLNLVTFQMTTLSPLQTPRGYSGLAKVNNAVFAFGGVDSGKILNICEKCHSLEMRWTKLRDMQYARSHFTPCQFQSLIYLVSTDNNADHRTVETFTPANEMFNVLRVSLPMQLTLGCSSVAFVAYGELHLLTEKKQRVSWKIESEGEFRLSSIDKGCSSTQQPLVVGTKVLIANEGKVLRFNLETNRFLT